MTTSRGFSFSSAYALSTIPFQNAFFKLICSYCLGLYCCITSCTDLLLQTTAAIKSAGGGSHQWPYAAIYGHTEQMEPKTPADFAAFHFFCCSRKGTVYGTRSGRYTSRSCLHARYLSCTCQLIKLTSFNAVMLQHGGHTKAIQQ